MSIQVPTLSVRVLEQDTKSASTDDEYINCIIDKHLQFNMSKLSDYFFTEWEPIIYDMLLLAAAVEFCDRTKRRPSGGWGRQIKLQVPVHDPAHWNSNEVITSLHDALSFLTGDNWKLSFSQRKKAHQGTKESLLKIKPLSAKVIMPFSDGLDSLAVGKIIDKEYGERVPRLRLGSKKENMTTDSDYFVSIPYKIKPANRFDESSVRSRGFKFSLLTGIAAYLSNIERIIIPESGQGALGPTLVPVAQTYEDYRNHPEFLSKIEILFQALLSYKVTYDFPRLWFTKGQTVSEYLSLYPNDSSWKDTKSCWQDATKASVNGKKRQCGVCAACMLRRLSVHAAGQDEDQKTYIWEDLKVKEYSDGAAVGFNNTRARGAMYEYAIAGTLHFDHLASIASLENQGNFIDRRCFTLSSTLNTSKSEVKKKLQALLNQHSNEWKRYISSLGEDSFIRKWAITGSKDGY